MAAQSGYNLSEIGREQGPGDWTAEGTGVESPSAPHIHFAIGSKRKAVAAGVGRKSRARARLMVR